jgi:hypothetical protein
MGEEERASAEIRSLGGRCGLTSARELLATGRARKHPMRVHVGALLESALNHNFPHRIATNTME